MAKNQQKQVVDPKCDLKKILKYQNLITCLILLSISCSTENPSARIPEMPTAIEECEFSLDDIASNISFIPLSSRELMQSIMEVKYFEPYFHIKTKDQKLYRFQKDGRLLDILYKCGRGPEEYMAINNFHADSEGNVIINTATEKRQMIYNNQLKFKQSISYPEGLDESYAYWINDKSIFFPLSIGKPMEYDWLRVDDEGGIIADKRYHDPGIRITFSNSASLLVFGIGDSLYRYRETSDTIFKIYRDGFEPIYTINRMFDDGLRMLTIEEVTRDITNLAELTPIVSREGKRRIQNIFDLGSNWIIHYRSEKYETVLFNRKENKFYLIASDIKSLPKLYNDFTGASDFCIKGIIEMEDCRYLLSYIDAYEFLNLTKSKEFSNGTPLLPLKKKEMKALADTISEDDNPVLILLKLKEDI